jgi:hypothetical protein
MFQVFHLNINNNQLSQKKVNPSKSVSSNLIAFTRDSKLKPLEKDTLDLSSQYINPAKINVYVREFSEKLVELCKNENPDRFNIKKIIDSTVPGLCVSVEHIKNAPEYAGKPAVLSTTFGKKPESTLYINLDIEPERIIQNTVHEFTHLLQDNTLENRAKIDVAKKYVSLEKVFKAFSEFENEFLHINYIEGVLQNQAECKLKLKNSSKANPFEEFNFATQQLRAQYDALIDEVLSRYNIKNQNAALEIFRLIADNEAQAYREGFLTKKNLAGTPQTEFIIQDLVPVMYDDLSEYLKNKIQEQK